MIQCVKFMGIREVAGHQGKGSAHLPDLITLSWTNNRFSKLHMEEFVFEIERIQGMIVASEAGHAYFS